MLFGVFSQGFSGVQYNITMIALKFLTQMNSGMLYYFIFLVCHIWTQLASDWLQMMHSAHMSISVIVSIVGSHTLITPIWSIIWMCTLHVNKKLSLCLSLIITQSAGSIMLLSHATCYDRLDIAISENFFQ